MSEAFEYSRFRAYKPFLIVILARVASLWFTFFKALSSTFLLFSCSIFLNILSANYANLKWVLARVCFSRSSNWAAYLTLSWTSVKVEKDFPRYSSSVLCYSFGRLGFFLPSSIKMLSIFFSRDYLKSIDFMSTLKSS